jgi:hypothetical protein
VQSANSKYLSRTANLPKHSFIPSEEVQLANGDASPFEAMAPVPEDDTIYDRYTD